MPSDFKFDKNALKKVVDEGMKETAKEVQRFLDSFARTHKGKPVEEIKRSLRQQWKSKLGGDITDPELTTYAEQIAAGGTIKVQAGKLR